MDIVDKMDSPRLHILQIINRAREETKGWSFSYFEDTNKRHKMIMDVMDAHGPEAAIAILLSKMQYLTSGFEAIEPHLYMIMNYQQALEYKIENLEIQR